MESPAQPYRAANPDLTDPEQLRAEVAKIEWFHSIDLGHGIVTPGGAHSGADKVAYHRLPNDLTGKTVLDIGAWDGLFSFEAERRGAARVLATDSYVWERGRKAGFELARRALGSTVEDLDIDVMDLSPERVGTFDVVLFLGVLYHLRHPLLALERVASVAGDLLILGTHLDMMSHERPAMAFYPHRELGDDPTNWWAPNVACLEAMLRDVGFAGVGMVNLSAAAVPGEPVVRHTGAFHARKR